MAKENKIGVKVESVPTLPSAPVVSEEHELEWSHSDKAVSYVVVRSGVRVSDADYLTHNDPRALAEKSFWQRVVNRHPDGTKVEVVIYDKKKHRIW